MSKRAPPVPGEHPAKKKRAPRQLPTDELSSNSLQAIFGRRLKVARLQRAMTLMEMAKATGISNQNISKIEHGKTNLTLATMARLAAVVGLDASEMIKPLEAEGEPAPRTSKKKPSNV